MSYISLAREHSPLRPPEERHAHAHNSESHRDRSGLSAAENLKRQVKHLAADYKQIATVLSGS